MDLDDGYLSRSGDDELALEAALMETVSDILNVMEEEDDKEIHNIAKSKISHGGCGSGKINLSWWQNTNSAGKTHCTGRVCSRGGLATQDWWRSGCVGNFRGAVLHHEAKKSNREVRDTYAGAFRCGHEDASVRLVASDE